MATSNTMPHTIITCPHCGKRFEHVGVVERYDINGTEAYFLPLGPDEERHIDMRVCCPRCYDAHGRWRVAGHAANPKDPPHPFGTRYHREVRLAKPVGQKL